MRSAAACATLAFISLWSTLRAPMNGDATAHVYLSYALVWQGSADVSEYAANPPPFSLRSIQTPRGTFTEYVPGNAMLFAPFAFGGGLLGLPPASPAIAGIAAKLAASIAVALSAGLLYALLERRAGRTTAAFVTALYVLGTAVLSIAGQIYLQHAPTFALETAALLLVLGRRPHRVHVGMAVLLLSIAVVVRLSDLVLLAMLLGFVGHRRRYALPYVLLWCLPAAILLGAYDLAIFGDPLRVPGGDVPPGSPLDGIGGLLISPSRGLLVYSPFLAAALVALLASWRWRSDDHVVLLRYGSLAFAVTLVIFGSYRDWLGGWNFGGRYLTDLLPVYMLALAEAWRRGAFAPLVARIALAVAAGWSILLNAAGAGVYYWFWYGTHWDVTPDIFDTRWRLWEWYPAQWQWVLARTILDPPPSLFVQAAVLLGCFIAFAAVGSRGVRSVPAPARESVAVGAR